MTNSIDNENVLLELRELTKKKENWETKIDDVAVKLNENYSDAVKAKMLWIIFLSFNSFCNCLFIC